MLIILKEALSQSSGTVAVDFIKKCSLELPASGFGRLPHRQSHVRLFCLYVFGGSSLSHEALLQLQEPRTSWPARATRSTSNPVVLHVTKILHLARVLSVSKCPCWWSRLCVITRSNMLVMGANQYGKWTKCMLCKETLDYKAYGPDNPRPQVPRQGHVGGPFFDGNQRCEEGRQLRCQELGRPRRSS